MYKNRVFPVDSNIRMDGEGLRPVFKQVNESEELLNKYQSQLKSTKWPAYVGTLGLITLVVGPIYSGGKESQVGKRDMRLTSIIAGASMAIGSYFYGQFLIGRKERTLESAIETYNTKAGEQDQIKVQLRTLPDKGAEIRTEVPF